jgi:hypothetical protein
MNNCCVYQESENLYLRHSDNFWTARWIKHEPLGSAVQIPDLSYDIFRTRHQTDEP